MHPYTCAYVVHTDVHTMLYAWIYIDDKNSAYIHVCIHTHMYVCVSVCVCVCVCVCARAPTFSLLSFSSQTRHLQTVKSQVCVNTVWLLCDCAIVCVCTHGFLCTSCQTRAFKITRKFHVCACACICACVRVCVRACLCACVCVRVCMKVCTCYVLCTCVVSSLLARCSCVCMCVGVHLQFILVSVWYVICQYIPQDKVHLDGDWMSACACADYTYICGFLYMPCVWYTSKMQNDNTPQWRVGMYARACCTCMRFPVYGRCITYLQTRDDNVF